MSQNCTRLKLFIKLRVGIVQFSLLLLQVVLLQAVLLQVTHNQSPFPQQEE